MSSENGEIYIMHDEGDAEWVRPKPARDAIVSVLTEVTDVEAEAVDELDTYLDPDALRATVDGERSEPLTFTIDDHEITIDGCGGIEVA